MFESKNDRTKEKKNDNSFVKRIELMFRSCTLLKDIKSFEKVTGKNEPNILQEVSDEISKVPI